MPSKIKVPKKKIAVLLKIMLNKHNLYQVVIIVSIRIQNSNTNMILPKSNNWLRYRSLLVLMRWCTSNQWLSIDCLRRYSCKHQLARTIKIYSNDVLWWLIGVWGCNTSTVLPCSQNRPPIGQNNDREGTKITSRNIVSLLHWTAFFPKR